MNDQEKELVSKLVQKSNNKICPKCDGYLHELRGEYTQDYCFSCGIKWTLSQLEDFCLEECDKLKMKRQAEQPFIAWCYDKFKQGVINEIKQ